MQSAGNLSLTTCPQVKLCYSKNKKVCEVNAATVPLGDLSNMTFQTRYYALPIKGQVSTTFLYHVMLNTTLSS